ncbi:MAG: dihydrodipicolinate reductase C-terminal domain-containing protein [Ilumatobacteraceae bacterium]|nr:hypothetical protein [Ilumatobacter sp.]MCB0985809.1 hypothetical protein [Ilumatobacter sp.]
MLRIGLVGFGKTGRAVASVMMERDDVRLEWILRRSARLDHRHASEVIGVDSDDPAVIHSAADAPAAALLDEFPVDAVVDFSSVTGIDHYGDAAAERGVSIVCAVSKFDRDVQPRFCEWGRHTRALWSPNITLGINFMLLAAKTLRAIAPCADVEVVEEHFKAKPEVSGTAVRLAEGLGLDPDGIKTVRAGGIIGTHELVFGFPFQVVRLRHESITREAFGNGAIFAAQHLHGRPNGFYRMEDLMAPYFARVRA